jgi:hypothetical protein
MKRAAEGTQKKLANISLSAEVLRGTLMFLSHAKCFAGSAVSTHGRRISPRRQLSFGYAERWGDWARRQRSACNHNGDPVVRISSSEGTDGYRASSTCTRGGSRQTRMYRS